MGASAGAGCALGAILGGSLFGPFGALIGAWVGGEMGFSVERGEAEATKRKQEALSKVNPHGSASDIARQLDKAGLTEIEFRQHIESRDGHRVITDEHLRKVTRH